MGPQGYLVDPGQVSRELAITLVRAPGAVPGAAPALVDGSLTIAEFKAKHAGTVAEAAKAEAGTTGATKPSGDAVSAERT